MNWLAFFCNNTRTQNNQEEVFQATPTLSNALLIVCASAALSACIFIILSVFSVVFGSTREPEDQVSLYLAAAAITAGSFTCACCFAANIFFCASSKCVVRQTDGEERRPFVEYTN